MKLLYCRRRLLFKTIRWYSTYRLGCLIIIIFVFFTIFLIFYFCVLIVYLNVCCFQSSNIIVSLTTTQQRFHDELVFTIHSLLTQTILPKEIRIYLSKNENNQNLTKERLKIDLKQVDSSKMVDYLFENLIQIKYEEYDYGPATKYLPIIKEFHTKSQAILVCDDDHYYHPFTIETLETYSKIYPNSILGFRGWRIRKDLHWGVSGDEMSHHIIESYRIRDMYRVGILTANHGYLIRSSFFDSHIDLDFAQVSNDIRRVDDIWLNGHAAKRNISRFVVPSCCFSISITRTHELENYFIKHQMTRSSANHHALKWFNQTWENDLWYTYHGKNQPKYRTWWKKLYRQWLNGIFQIKFFIYN